MDWLPNREKHDFLILDFNIGGHSNIRFHELKQSKESEAGTDVLTKIFLNRLSLLKKGMDKEQKQIIEDKILADIDALNKDSFIVREKLPVIRKVVTKKFDLKSHIEELKKEIAPLVALNPGDSAPVSAFVLQVEKLFGYIVEGKNEEIFEVRQYIEDKMNNILLKENLEAVSKKKVEIVKVFEEAFWDDLSFEDVEFIIKELSPLMVYYEPEAKDKVQIDAPDTILKIEQLEKTVKEDTDLKNFVATNPLLKKIKDGEGITSSELVKLEQQLHEIRPEITIENVERIQNTDFILFLRKIVGLSQDYDPKEMIEREFDEHIIKKSQNYNSEQIRFLQVMKKVFARTKRIELVDFTLPPLANEGPLDKFPPSELERIVTVCKKIRMK
jgi:type I restriction enzyme R subunit